MANQLAGKAPSDSPALKPYRGKPAVRNFRGGNGNVGIIRSPVRAIALPDSRLAFRNAGRHWSTNGLLGSMVGLLPRKSASIRQPHWDCHSSEKSKAAESGVPGSRPPRKLPILPL
jgi:hypothetical protein